MPNISDIVRVTAQIAPQGVLRREFGRTLFLYTAVDSSDPAVIRGARARDLRVNAYASQTAVAADYDSGDPAYDAGAIYFRQVPYPRDFVTAAWFPAGAATWLLGAAQDGTETAFLAAIKALGSQMLAVAGQNVTVNLNVGVDAEILANTDTVEYVYQATADDTAPATPSGGATEDDFVPDGWSAASIDPTAALPYVWRSTRTQSDDAWTANDFAAPELWARTPALGLAAVADALQVQLRTILQEAEVAYANNAFSVSMPDGADLGGSLSGDAATTLGLGSTAFYALGRPAETITEVLDRIQSIDDSWYWLAVDSAIFGDVGVTGARDPHALDVAAWAASKEVQFVLDNVNTGVLEQNESLSVPAVLSALEYDRTSVVWSRTADYKAVSLAGRFSSVNFSAPNSLITAKFKDLPGTLPDDISGTEKAEIDRKRLNVYAPYGGDAIFAEGWTLRPGTWIDVRYWLDWLVNATQVAVYNLLRRSPARIPQTDEGVKAIEDVVEGIMEQGVRNGGAAPGRLSEALANDIRLATGNGQFDGFLSNGYLVYVTPIAQQSQADRALRKAPPVRCWVRGSGAVHFVEVDIQFTG